MIQSSPFKCTSIPDRLRLSAYCVCRLGVCRLARIAALVCFCMLSACSDNPDRVPHWLTGEPDLPPVRPEVAQYRNAPTPSLASVPDRPFPSVDVEQRQQMRTDLAGEGAAATAAAMPIRQDMAAQVPPPDSSVVPSPASPPSVRSSSSQIQALQPPPQQSPAATP